MSLLDSITTAKGQPTANYLKGGRHVLKISRLQWRENDPDKPTPSFRLDGEILKSSNPLHQEQVGSQGTMNLGFKFASTDLAKMRRALTAALSSAEGRKALESEITAAKTRELCSESQPLNGTIVVVVATEKPQKGDKTKSFTHYEVEVPTERDVEDLPL